METKAKWVLIALKKSLYQTRIEKEEKILM